MSLEYLSESGRKYVLSYSALRVDYERFCRMTEAEFLAALPEILHFACIVSYLKELGIGVLSDEGIIHQLVHLLTIPNEPLISIVEIRAQFAEQLRLA